MANQKFVANTIYLQLVGSDKTLQPISFSYHEQINTVCDYFDFELLDTLDNYIPRLRSTEIRVFIDEEFFVGGYLDSFEKSENSNTCRYTFITYGYQIAISDMINSYQYTNFADGTIIDFIDNVLKSNFKQVKKIGSIEKEAELREVSSPDTISAIGVFADMVRFGFRKSPKYALPITVTESIGTVSYDEIQTTYPLNFIIYDPDNLGNVQISTLIKQLPQTKKEITNVFEFITNLLKIDNIYIKCIGRLEDLGNKLDRNHLYNNRAGNVKYITQDLRAKEKSFGERSIEYDSENFVLELWRPTGKLYNTADTLEAQEKEQGKFTYVDIENTVEQSKKHYSRSVMEKFGFADKISNRETQSTNTSSIYNICNLIFNPNSSSTNLVSVPAHKVSFSELYNSYIVQGTTTNEEDSSDQGNTVLPISNPNIGDGTTKILQYNRAELPLQSLAQRDINRKITENYSYSCTAIGFRQDTSINDLNNGFNAKSKPFYGTRQIVYLNVNYGTSTVNNFFLVDNVDMNYDNSSGFTTNIHLCHPSAYCDITYNIINFERQIQNTLIKYYKGI